MHCRIAHISVTISVEHTPIAEQGAACAGFPEKSIFFGRDINARVHVDWGTFSLVAALKELITSALGNPLNQKFMLISESGIPLYPGETMWVELMVEEKSRINACELGVRCSFREDLAARCWMLVDPWVLAAVRFGREENAETQRLDHGNVQAVTCIAGIADAEEGCLRRR